MYRRVSSYSGTVCYGEVCGKKVDDLVTRASGWSPLLRYLLTERMLHQNTVGRDF